MMLSKIFAAYFSPSQFFAQIKRTLKTLYPLNPKCWSYIFPIDPNKLVSTCNPTFMVLKPPSQTPPVHTARAL